MRLLHFAKVFQVLEGDVLVRKFYDADNEEDQLHVTVAIENGPELEIKLTHSSQEKRDKVFNEWDQTRSEEFVTKVAGEFLKDNQELKPSE